MIGRQINHNTKETLSDNPFEQENGKRVLLALEGARLGLFEYHPQSGKLQWINDLVFEIFGRSPVDAENLKNWLYREVLHEEDVKVFEKALEETTTTGGHFQVSCRIKQAKEEKVQWVEFSGHLFKQGDSEILVGTIQDISDRKRLEIQRQRFMELGSDLQVIADEKGYFKWVNPAFEKLLGWTREELTSQPWTFFIHPDDQENTLRETQDIFLGKTTFAFENRYRTRQGNYVWLRWKSRAYANEKLIYGTAVNISAQKQLERNSSFLLNLTEEMVRLSEDEAIMELAGQKLGHYLNCARAVFSEYDLANQKVYIIHNWCKPGIPGVTGEYALPDFLDKETIKLLSLGKQLVSEDVQNDPRTSHKWSFYQKLNIGATVSTPFVSDSICKYSLSVHYPESHQFSPDDLNFLRDVSFRVWSRVERARTETALWNSEKQLRLITDALPVLISYADTNHVYRFVNRTYTEWFGIEHKEIIGHHLKDVLGEAAYEAILPRVIKVLSGEAVTYEQHLPYKHGGRYVLVNYIPDIRTDREIKGFFVLVTDITERKREEANRLFLSETAEDLGRISSVKGIIEKVGEKLGDFLEIKSCFFTDIDDENDQATISYTWNGTTEIPDLHGTYGLSDFITPIYRNAARQGETIVIGDTQNDERLNAESYKKFNVHALVSVPFMKDGQWKYMVTIADVKPRIWRKDEIDLIKEKTNRLCLRIERARAEQAIREREQLLEVELEDSKQLQQISTQFILENNLDLLYDKVLEASVALMRSDMASLQMYNQESGELDLLAWRDFHPESAAFWKKIHLNSGSTCGESLRTRERIILPDIETADFLVNSEDYPYFKLSGIRAIQTTPLITRDGRLVGMISTHWKEIHQPSERELRIFDVLARQAADLIERINTEADIRRSNERYQMLFNSIDEGFCVCEMLYDETGKAVDYRFQEVNPAYVKLTGLKDAIGKTGRELEPNLEEKWFEIYSRVLESGEAIRFESHLKAWNKWYDLYVTPAGKSSENKFAILFSDITNRKKYENALIDSDRRKDEFLATLSHELRNPLTPIKGALEMMESGVDEQTNQKFRDIMKRQVNKMAHLIDDLMDISRITRGKIHLQKKTIDLAVAVKEVMEAVDSLMTSENHNFTVELPETPVYIHADLNRIVQILTNLLSNSARYTDPGGKITLTLAKAAENAVIKIKDNGIGISQEYLESIFEMFSQVKSNQRGQHSGLGIGLSLVKNLVEMHEGTVKAFSDGENKGSTFVLTFPLLNENNQEEAKSPDDKEQKVKSSSRKLKIVVLDDNKDIADMIRSGLKFEGHDVISCYTGSEALECIDGFNPEAAVLDIGLPDYDGYELANIIRKRFPDIFLIAHSGWGQEKDKIKALEAGFNRHLVKPAGLKDILAVLNELKN